MPEQIKMKICSACGCIIEEDSDYACVEGDLYCESCLQRAVDYGEIFWCEDCEEYHSTDNSYYIENLHRYVCEDCFENNLDYFQCDDCGDYYCDTGDNRYTLANGADICWHCFDRGDYYSCYNCGEIYHCDDMHYDDDEWWCNDCYNRYARKKKIHDYGYKPDPKFKASNHDDFYTDSSIKELLFGVELEVDRGSDAEALADSVLNDNDDVYFKHDGSLGSEGVEIVSHPATLQYHMEDLGWKDIMNCCRVYEFLSHDTSTCGLHVHVGRRQLTRDWTISGDEVIAKIIVMLSRLHDPIVLFTRRKVSALQRWAEMPHELPKAYPISNDDALKEWALEDSWDNMNDRYHALNLRNYNTIEFRIFRGTLNLETFLATLQFVSNLCKTAMNEDWDTIRRVQFRDIIEYEHFDELTNYVKRRGIDLSIDVPEFKYVATPQRPTVEELNTKIKAGEEIAHMIARHEWPMVVMDDQTPRIGDVVKYEAEGFKALGVVVDCSAADSMYLIKFVDYIGETETWEHFRMCLHDNGGRYATNEYYWITYSPASYGRLRVVLPF